MEFFSASSKILKISVEKVTDSHFLIPKLSVILLTDLLKRNS
ncbi:hypothetical protein AM2_0930 [Lactococcus cremoris]|nr:hypothetical protein AM2_0930 [Lactococcus cremoris]